MKFIKALINGRQRKANLEIARLIKHEFPYESFEYVVDMLEKGDIHARLRRT